MLIPFLIALAQAQAPKPIPVVADDLPRGFGYAVELCGDLDGDGRSEFAIGGRGWFKFPAGVVIYGGRYGGVFRRITTTVEGEFIRGPICRTGDLDGDHVDDLAVSIGSDSGRVEIRSGKSGAVVRTLSPINGEVDFGIGLCRLGDVDADGVNDLVITAGLGAPTMPLGDAVSGADDHAVRWIVVSGASGQRLRAVEWKGPADHGWHLSRENASAVAIGDVNGDGLQDFAVVDESVVRVESGAKSQTLLSIPVVRQAGKNSYRISILGIPDADADGHPDLIVGTPYAKPPGEAKPTTYLTIYSGASGSEIRSITRPMEQLGFGFALCLAPMKNADGSQELWLTRHDWFGTYLCRVSVATGEDRAVVRDYAATDNFGYAIASGGDVDGDGVDDVIVGAYSQFGGSRYDGGSVYSGRDGHVLWQKRIGPIDPNDSER